MNTPTDDFDNADSQKGERKRRSRSVGAPENPTAEIENAIRPVKRRQPAHAEPATERRSRQATAPPSAQKMPEEIWERFIGIGAKYYFPDGNPAFVDRGDRLTTPSENTEVVRSLITIAQARGWNSIEVAGSERFRREAWFAAQRVGLDVRGYKASAVEQAQLIRSLVPQRAPQPDTAGREGGAVVGDRPIGAGEVPAREPAEPARGAREGVFVGRLIEHGSANYRHDPREQSSYYLRLQTQQGEREVWGVDLERALRHSLSHAKIGDEVTVRAVGQEIVTVPTSERNERGEVVGRKPLTTHRNEWTVERTAFLADRQRIAQTFRDEKVSPQDAVKKHPELQGSYLKLQAVRLGAERDMPDVQMRNRLIARGRVLIAESIERGEPLEPVRLRAAPRKGPEPGRPPREEERTR